MSAVIAQTQAELDAALSSGETLIVIESPSGVWLTVEASGLATVRASGSATVRAFDSATVEASSHVAVHLHSASVTVSGGIAIDVAALDMSDPRAWCAYHLIGVGETAVVYKAVSGDFIAGQRHIETHYTIGETVVASDWRSDPECGHGLHFSPSPRQALIYYMGGDETSVRFLACEVTVSDVVPLGDKVKAPSCRVLHEVDIDGQRRAEAALS